MFEQTKQKMCQAIREQRKIVYTYVVGNDRGKREGDPHIVYISTKAGKWMVQMRKTGGVRTDKSKELPAWRTYCLADIEILEMGGKFVCHKDFNPHNKQYANTVCSVKL